MHMVASRADQTALAANRRADALPQERARGQYRSRPYVFDVNPPVVYLPGNEHDRAERA
jgi:hypothetical protein